MQSKVNPAMVGVAIVVLIALCAFIYMRANSSQSPQQLPPPSGAFKPGYGAPTVDMKQRHPNGMPGSPNGRAAANGGQ